MSTGPENESPSNLKCTDGERVRLSVRTENSSSSSHDGEVGVDKRHESESRRRRGTEVDGRSEPCTVQSEQVGDSARIWRTRTNPADCPGKDIPDFLNLLGINQI